MILKLDLSRVSGSFVPILYYLDLRCQIPTLKKLKPAQPRKKPVIDIDSVLLTINDEILSEESEI